VNGERDADASSIEQISRQDVVGPAHTMEQPMTRLNILTAGLLAATLATPVMAQEVIPEPGPIAQNYPDADYITGG
jgi:hypothetical protein